MYTMTSFIEVFFFINCIKVSFTPGDNVSQFICLEMRIKDKTGDEVNGVLSANIEFVICGKTYACIV